MQQVLSTTSARQQRRALVIAVLATMATVASAAANAGQCPADKVVADGKGQPMNAAMAQGVTDTVVVSTDLSQEPLMISGRLFRARKLEIAPGGVVPWHSHGDRPAQILIASGEITEYASTCTVPIVHKAGDITAERSPTAHWWKNHGTAPVVIYSFDLFRAEDKKMEKMM